MNCALCASSNQAEVGTEINVCPSGLKNLDRPSVLLFAKILVCLKCGFSRNCKYCAKGSHRLRLLNS